MKFSNALSFCIRESQNEYIPQAFATIMNKRSYVFSEEIRLANADSGERREENRDNAA